MHSTSGYFCKNYFTGIGTISVYNVSATNATTTTLLPLSYRNLNQTEISIKVLLEKKCLPAFYKWLLMQESFYWFGNSDYQFSVQGVQTRYARKKHPY